MYRILSPIIIHSRLSVLKEPIPFLICEQKNVALRFVCIFAMQRHPFIFHVTHDVTFTPAHSYVAIVVILLRLIVAELT